MEKFPEANGATARDELGAMAGVSGKTYEHAAAVLESAHGLTEQEKRTHARKLNMARRQLSNSQKEALTKAQIMETPEKSNRAIAANLGVSDPYVGKVRKQMESSGEVLTVSTSTGKDGKVYPRQVERRPAVEPVRETPVMMEPETPTPFVRRGTEMYHGTGYTPNQCTPSEPLASDGVSVRHGIGVAPARGASTRLSMWPVGYVTVTTP